MPQLQIPVELVILHLAMLAFLEKYQVQPANPPFVLCGEGCLMQRTEALLMLSFMRVAANNHTSTVRVALWYAFVSFGVCHVFPSGVFLLSSSSSSHSSHFSLDALCPPPFFSPPSPLLLVPITAPPPLLVSEPGRTAAFRAEPHRRDAARVAGGGLRQAGAHAVRAPAAYHRSPRPPRPSDRRRGGHHRRCRCRCRGCWC